MKKRAVVLLSGGLDSATTLYIARKKGFECFSLAFDYGQRHRRELESAKRIACAAGSRLKIIRVSLPWKGSSLIDRKLRLPRDSRLRPPSAKSGIPSTYVPGRNLIFLSFAVSYAEAIKADAIFIGAHSQDYSGYPDCRPEFYRALNRVIAQGTKAGVEKQGLRIEVPLINKNKAQIIKLGERLRVPFGLTWSCYQGGASPCARCDSCFFRAKGFKEAGLEDPLVQR